MLRESSVGLGRARSHISLHPRLFPIPATRTVSVPALTFPSRAPVFARHCLAVRWAKKSVPRWAKGMGPGHGTRVDLRGKGRQALLLVRVYRILHLANVYERWNAGSFGRRNKGEKCKED